ncbi:DUF485 domain-containing protein [Streptomyces sp. NPDC047928]|uniref:DUF485 domain-containing protein n=1 Tax=unclassified Streptomyces TaxID=2593676 RepID=UPI00372199A3
MSYPRPFPDPPPSRHTRDAASYFQDAPAPQRQDAPAPPRRDADLDALRSGYRRLRRVSTLTALGYFVLFLLLSAYAPGLMTSELTGGLNIGLVLGLCQLPVALTAIALYERIARRRVDSLAETLRNPASQAPHASYASQGSQRSQGSQGPQASQWSRASQAAGGPAAHRGSWADDPGYRADPDQWQWSDGTTGGVRS